VFEVLTDEQLCFWFGSLIRKPPGPKLSDEGGQNSAEFKDSNSARICGIIKTVQNTIDHLLFVILNSYDYVFPGILGTA
jgi:hypothetical protein